MFAIMLKLYGIISPFFREIFLGNKKVKKQDRNINYFLIGVSTLLFLMFIVSSFTNSKLITKTDELNKSLEIEKNKTASLSTDIEKYIKEIDQYKNDLQQCDSENEVYIDKINEYEEVSCAEKPDSLFYKLRNLEDGDCKLTDIHIREGMPQLPNISKLDSTYENSDKKIGELLLNYVSNLREYIRQQNELVEKEKANCK